MMLDKDMKYSKIMRDCRSDVEREDLATVIKNIYPMLKNIYHYYVARSKSYPALDKDDLDIFCRNFGMGSNRNLPPTTVDRIVT